jgi:hypothetical protein
MITLQQLEMHIKNELIEKTRLVRPVPSSEESYSPQHSLSVACGAPVSEVHMAVPKWASQVCFFVTGISNLIIGAYSIYYVAYI